MHDFIKGVPMWDALRPKALLLYGLLLPFALCSPLIYILFISRSSSWSLIFSTKKNLGPIVDSGRLSLWMSMSYVVFWVCRITGKCFTWVIGYAVRHHSGREGILPGTVKLLEFSSSLAWQLFNVVWASSNWVIVHLLLRHHQLVARIGGAWILAVCILIFIEKAILHTIVTSFHRTVYVDRIMGCMRSLWVVKSLQKTALQFGYKRPKIDNFVVRRTLPNYATANLVTTFLLENASLQASGRHAKLGKLFKFLTNGEPTLKKDHLKPYISDASLPEAFSTFSPIMDEVDQAEFIKAIDAVYAERKSLVKILGENDDLVHKLDQILMGIVGILGVMMLVPISGVGPILPIGISLAPMVVILTLAFADTLKSVVAAIVFIFSAHPFDIGDLVYMDRGTFFVRKIRLLSTLFRRWDGVYVYYPNSLLATMSISNVRRTGPQAIRFEVNLSMDSTSTKTIQSLQQKLLQFVEDNPTDYADLQPVLFELRPGLNKLVMVLKLRLQHSYQDPYRRVLRFNKFWGYTKEAMESLGITFETPTMQIQSDDPLE